MTEVYMNVHTHTYMGWDGQVDVSLEVFLYARKLEFMIQPQVGWRDGRRAGLAF